MTSSAMVSQGIIFRISTDSGSTWRAVAEITSFNGPSPTRNEIDVTSFDSTAKEFLGALTDNGELTMDCNFIPTDTNGQAALLADLANAQATEYTCQLILTDAGPTVAEFTAYCKSFPAQASTDGKIAGTIGMRITGAITWQQGTA